MAVYRSLLLVTFAYSVFSEQGGLLFEPCNRNDIKCLSSATENFLEKTCKGLPAYNILPLDPLIIPELDVIVDEDMGIVFKFTNLNVTGLKNQQISDFKMDIDKKSVELKTRADLNILADVTIEFTKKNKQFNGVYSASTTILGCSKYGYSLVKRDDNEYFEVGAETNSCEVIGEPFVNINDELQNALDNDADAKELKSGYETNKVPLRKKTICKIVETSYITVIHNLRSSAKIFPKSAFFNDI